MALREFTIEVPGGQPLVIYAEPDNINWFLNGTLEPDGRVGVENKQTAVPGYSRRQFPGDLTPISVAGSQREFLFDPEMRTGSAIPGVNFMLVAYADPDPGLERFTGTPIEKRQFTYKGRFIDLHTFIAAEATYDTMLHNHTGAKHPIEKATAP